MSELENITAAQPLVLVGCGRMGSAMLAGWLARGLAPAAVLVIDPDVASRGRLETEHPGIGLCADAADLGVAPSVVVLAVKPQIMDQALVPLANHSEALYVSIAAGKTLDYFNAHLKGMPAIVRAMPNTPAAIGQGMTVCVPNGQVSDLQRSLCTALMEAVGAVAWIDDENLMDAVTALSGSGPAYVFHLIESMAAAGQALGLPEDQALLLARQTVTGAGALVDASPETSAAELRQNVTSPGGTTEAALNVLMGEGGLAPLMRRALAAAAKRSKELSG